MYPVYRGLKAGISLESIEGTAWISEECGCGHGCLNLVNEIGVTFCGERCG